MTPPMIDDLSQFLFSLGRCLDTYLADCYDCRIAIKGPRAGRSAAVSGRRRKRAVVNVAVMPQSAATRQQKPGPAG